MDNPTAIEKARALCKPGCGACRGSGYVEVHQPGYTHYETDAGDSCPLYHFRNVPCACNRENEIAAALKRAYADGIQWAAEHWASSLEDEEKRLREEADQLEGK